MVNPLKKIRKKLGVGGRQHDVDNNDFVLDVLWPYGTWYLEEKDNQERDFAVRCLIYDTYAYEEKIIFEQTVNRTYRAAANVPKIPFDWMPTADLIRRYQNSPNFPTDNWVDDEINYVLARLQGMNQLRT